jgi:predicted RNA-binding Zn-ribbon protein involved in translation (DUF1610 family)
MTMINHPCPSCGSDNVKWRRRRWYDGPLNVLEGMLTIATTKQTHAGAHHAFTDPRSFDQEYQREQRRKMGRRVAELFYRCADCKSSGEDFEEWTYRPPTRHKPPPTL